MSDVAEQQETSLESMQSILERQKYAYLAEGEVSFATRFDRLERAIQVVRANEQRFIDAMTADFGHRSEHQSLFTDIASSVTPLRHAQKHMKQWMKREKRSLTPALLGFLVQKLGSTISPWGGWGH